MNESLSLPIHTLTQLLPNKKSQKQREKDLNDLVDILNQFYKTHGYNVSIRHGN